MDPEDIPKDACSATSNFEIDVRGKLTKRKGRVAIGDAVTTRAFVQLAKWIVASTNYWLTYDTTARLIERYSSTMGSQTEIGLALGSGTDDIKILLEKYGIEEKKIREDEKEREKKDDISTRKDMERSL